MWQTHKDVDFKGALSSPITTPSIAWFTIFLEEKKLRCHCHRSKELEGMLEVTVENNMVYHWDVCQISDLLSTSDITLDSVLTSNPWFLIDKKRV